MWWEIRITNWPDSFTWFQSFPVVLFIQILRIFAGTNPVPHWKSSSWSKSDGLNVLFLSLTRFYCSGNFFRAVCAIKFSIYIVRQTVCRTHWAWPLLTSTTGAAQLLATDSCQDGWEWLFVSRGRYQTFPVPERALKQEQTTCPHLMQMLLSTKGCAVSQGCDYKAEGTHMLCLLITTRLVRQCKSPLYMLGFGSASQPQRAPASPCSVHSALWLHTK